MLFAGSERGLIIENLFLRQRAEPASLLLGKSKS